MNITKARLILLLVLLLTALLRYLFWLPKFTAADLAFYNDKSKITFSGLVDRQPDLRIDRAKLTVAGQDFRGKVLISTDLYPEYHYGDLLLITCGLKTPAAIEDFAYDKYLAKDKIYSVCYQPQIKLLEHNRGNKFYAKIFLIKDKFRSVINQSIAFPYSALLVATLFGGGNDLPTELAADFSRASLTHIIAVSGSHIVLITVFLSNFFLALNLRRRVAFYFIVASLIVFIIMIGFPPAAVRSVIMGIIGLLALQTGRLSNSSWALFLSAALMLALNPWLLFHDVGFQLSFLATWGMIKFSSPINSLFLKFKLRLPEVLGLRETLTATMAAQIATLPLIVYQFNQLSLVAPLANILILPVIPVIMLLGFIFTLLGLISLSLSKVLFWLAYPFLFYFARTVEVLGGARMAAITDLKMGRMFFVAGYLLLITWVYRDNLLKFKIWLK